MSDQVTFTLIDDETEAEFVFTELFRFVEDTAVGDLTTGEIVVVSPGRANLRVVVIHHTIIGTPAEAV